MVPDERRGLIDHLAVDGVSLGHAFQGGSRRADFGGDVGYAKFPPFGHYPSGCLASCRCQEGNLNVA